MSRSRLILLVATTALVISAVVLFMRDRGNSSAGQEPAAGAELAKAHASTRAARSNPSSTPEGPASRDPRPEPTRTLDQINTWLADDSLPPEEAAKKLWGVFADTRQTKEVRQEALAHALNLTTDKRLLADDISLYEQPGLWSGEIGETALDELYNRGKGAKLAAGAALLGHASGEFRDHLRELLRFELDDPDADDATLIRKAHDKLGGKLESAE